MPNRLAMAARRHPGLFPVAIFLIGLLNGAALLGWTDSERQIVRGALLLAGVGLVVFARSRRRGRAHT